MLPKKITYHVIIIQSVRFLSCFIFSITAIYCSHIESHISLTNTKFVFWFISLACFHYHRFCCCCFFYSIFFLRVLKKIQNNSTIHPTPVATFRKGVRAVQMVGRASMYLIENESKSKPNKNQTKQTKPNSMLFLFYHFWVKFFFLFYFIFFFHPFCSDLAFDLCLSLSFNFKFVRLRLEPNVHFCVSRLNKSVSVASTWICVIPEKKRDASNRLLCKNSLLKSF